MRKGFSGMRVSEIVTAVQGRLIQGNEDVEISSVSIDSREIGEGCLFVPIIGERVDAHRFLLTAFGNGAAAALISREQEEYAPDGTYILVQDTVAALQDMAAAYRDRFDIPVVGITGSVGKTTTKEMISAALKTEFSVLKTAGNRNSQVGLPLTVLTIEPEHTAAVIEMGMSERGEMEKLARVARPNIAVLTNIGVSHIGQLGSQENIRKEKLNIIDEFKPGDVLILNGDDPLLRELAQGGVSDLDEKTLHAMADIRIVTFSAEGNADYTADDIVTDGEATSFTLRTGDGRSEEIKLSVIGLHNVRNALAALVVSDFMGIPFFLAKQGLKDYRPIKMRGEVKETGGIKIIDDTYNASPDSMKSGIGVLTALPGLNRRIAVLADVKELGERSEKLHYEVGVFLADQNVDILVTVGAQAREIARAVRERGRNMVTASFDQNEEAIAWLKDNIAAGDGILVKGSRGMHTEDIVSALTGRDE
ncbi:UDP-N-acetylmuramoyl-tripeptide--D-alanyl-D-alanine ligase [Anaerolentibacter hominis]|uniref:UDP-N-acetylmuramoyl-tripeptide--D-alanyl-D- alanine ligase n=1 Tax=Anaerolentibacter hominis TaxID=3079009 RepID=UPI0031B8807C